MIFFDFVHCEYRCSSWGGENLQHILKSCVQNESSMSDAFSPVSIESDLGISMLHVAHSRLADFTESIKKAPAGEIWPAAAALETAWCLIDGIEAATDLHARSVVTCCHSAEALIRFCCRHPSAICQQLQSLILPLISYQKLLSEDLRVALCAAFVPWCDHEISSAILNFRILESEDSHMRVLRQAALTSSAIWIHFVSHIAALQQRSPRSLFLTAFAVSAAAFDSAPMSIDYDAWFCGSHFAHCAPVTEQRTLSLSITCKMQGAKRKALPCDSSAGLSNNGRSNFCCPDDAYALRCSYVSSLLCGLHAEVSCVRSYITTGGNVFELLPLLHWVLAAEGSNVIDISGHLGLGELESFVCAVLEHKGTIHIGHSLAPQLSLLEAIVIVGASDFSSRENEILVSSSA
jgi:hypothetical protein